MCSLMMMMSDMLSKHVGAVKSVLKKWFKISGIQLVHLLVVWYLQNEGRFGDLQIRALSVLKGPILVFFRVLFYHVNVSRVWTLLDAFKSIPTTMYLCNCVLIRPVISCCRERLTFSVVRLSYPNQTPGKTNQLDSVVHRRQTMLMLAIQLQSLHYCCRLAVV